MERLRRLLRAWPLYTDLRRWQREGFGNAVTRYRLWASILNSPPCPVADRGSRDVELHALCHRLDYLPAVWALKSFYHQSGVDFPLVLHVNGRVSRTVYRRLAEHFPGATLLPQEEANTVVEGRLREGRFDRLLRARRSSPFMIKLIDVPLLARGPKVLTLDSDVLFFQPPTELLDHCHRPPAGYVFQADAASTYNVSAETALALLGVRLPPRVNSGMIVYAAGTPDLATFERYLGNPDVSVPNGFIEQTLFALHAGEVGVTLLPEERYLVSLGRGMSHQGVVARHYAGASRPLFTSEGIPLVEVAGNWRRK